ncbi:MAG: oligosaccharide flippase family protein [Candidatus Cloacimonetes bacterium]|nr:oligosaccharide flippase family protein [Candidatus Cloacimonadota bacterium]
MSDLSKQAGILSATEFFRFFVKSIIGIALARLILPAELGSYRQLFLIYSTFSTLLLLGIPQSLLYFLPQSKSASEQSQIIKRTLSIVSLLGLVFSLSIYLLRGFIATKFNNPSLESLLIFYAIYPIFIFITQLYSSIMLGLKRPLDAARFTLFSITADFILILGVAFFTRNLQMIVFAVIISAMLQWIYARVHLWKFQAQKVAFDFVGFRKQLAYSIPLGVSSIIGMLSVQLDKFMISGFFSPAQFAIFSIGAMELPLIGILANSVNSILLPHLSSREPQLMGELYRGAVRKNALIVFPIAAVFFLFAEPMVVFLYGAIYAEAALFFKIYLCILPLRIATYGIVFQAFGKTKVIMANAIFTLLLNAILNYMFIRIWGMKGAAFATVIVTWLSVIFYLVLMKGLLHLSLREFFPINKVFRTFIATALSALACLPLISYMQPGLLSMLTGGALFIVLYFFLGRWLGAILSCDIALIQDLLKSAQSRFKR